MSTDILQLRGVGKSFRAADGRSRAVLDGVDFTLREGEIVALLGQSGSGKSTLLRIMAGLVEADQGDVRYRGQPLYGPARGISMVFQSFALFPWLTVQQNVELGLEARGVAAEVRAQKAQSAIELIGLAGFEGALPRELSGGMRQRVGIARALVTEPHVLLMDEAFSALDVLTGERLREDILELWTSGQMPTKAMLVVSHNIEEAVMMADRVLVFASDPGRVRSELAIALPHPRDAESAEVRALIDQVYGLMTGARAGTAAPVAPALATRLPAADVARMDDLLELLADEPFNGRADLPQLSEESELTDAELLPAAHAVSLLGLAHLADGDLQLSPLGRRYVDGSHTLRHEVFGQQLLTHVPLAAHIRHSLEQEATGELPEAPFLRLLSEALEPAEARQVLQTIVSWARHGEVFEYDFNARTLRLPDQTAADGA
ncbi:nitrate/sulfonate/bicarbonate ABC transporter ATP-binding protein [Ideonella dechloratans]|uniref:Nitrate/sulfonate/bicarbonate ABC transporter ATP-binding protein n=1 Tax=Ideonella dechloratans TaxID=36863 RepID=A0A643FFU8_IDEDE|nr:nitrate/sulfonate/bicarbonate ABC transporter ATP-binding protein [Ideonella dechloratans]KAB0583951.1 nitrate/sulfonate/bicarbonate ABC transporter ATP-binding protein [Ideonella dechloratans]UFU12564.1 nitrate/sulfonate/bicarbonate ABC transporter ATP-binding protein [Ideonella dechloratans]